MAIGRIFLAGPWILPGRRHLYLRGCHRPDRRRGAAWPEICRSRPVIEFQSPRMQGGTIFRVADHPLGAAMIGEFNTPNCMIADGPAGRIAGLGRTPPPTGGPDTLWCSVAKEHDAVSWRRSPCHNESGGVYCLLSGKPRWTVRLSPACPRVIVCGRTTHPLLGVAHDWNMLLGLFTNQADHKAEMSLYPNSDTINASSLRWIGINPEALYRRPRHTADR
jgi:hypothetical protein